VSKRKKGAPDGALMGVYGDFLNIAKGSNPQVQRQTMLEQLYVQILCELSMNRYKWTGLPESINPRHLEMTLLTSGLSVFYFDNDFGKFFALQGTPAGQMNMQNDPLKYQVYGNQFINKTLNAMPQVVRQRDEHGRFTSEALTLPEECVPIWANYLRRSDMAIIYVYAARLAEFDRTIEINAKNARRPKILAVDQALRLSIANINRQIDEGQSAIEINAKTFDDTMGGIAALDLGINPDTIEKIQISRTRVWNECMGLLGINNANQDKKERLVASEVGANDEQVDMMRWVNLNARRQAAHMINVRWPELTIGVTFHTTDQDTSAPEPLTSDSMDEDEGNDPE
jgi:hypothetical protein